MTVDEIKDIIGFITFMVLIVVACRWFLYEVLSGGND